MTESTTSSENVEQVTEQETHSGAQQGSAGPEVDSGAMSTEDQTFADLPEASSNAEVDGTTYYAQI